MSRISLIFFAIFMLVCDMALATDYSILMIIHSKYYGDVGQMKGVSSSLSQYITSTSPNNTVSVKEVDARNVLDIIREEKSHNRSIILLTAGNNGIDDVVRISKTEKDVYIVHMAHQIFDSYDLLLKPKKGAEGADLVVLPRHVIESDIHQKFIKSETQLLPTPGVCHNVTLESLNSNYRDNKDVLPEYPKYLVVMLAGDAQRSDGSWAYYTKDEAAKLAKHLKKMAEKNNQYILLFNGPRTGMHNTETGEIIMDVHMNNNIDAISQEFLSHFNESDRIKFFNFQFDAPSRMYYAALAATVKRPGSDVYIPGESVSMISEAVDIHEIREHLYIYIHDGMQSSHLRYVMTEYHAARASLLTANMQIKRRGDIDSSQTKTSNEYVAESIVHYMGQR